MTPGEDRHLKAVRGIVDTCADLTLDEALLVMELAWLTTAQKARATALAFPDGFPAERGRQLDHLHKMAALVEGDVPDLEAERLCAEEDWEGLERHMRNLLDKEGNA